MRVLLPRRKKCAVCRNPIPGTRRIDCIYCKKSCNNLAWRRRTGKRWGGRLPTRASATKAGKAEGRDAPTRGSKAAQEKLLASKKHITELTAQMAESQRQAHADTQNIVDLHSTIARERADRAAEAERMQAELVAERERGQAAVLAEQQRGQAALEAERERSQAALLAKQQRSQVALDAERESQGERLRSAMMDAFVGSLELTMEREQRAIEAARMQAELVAIQERCQAALLVERQRDETALKAEQGRLYERLLSAMTDNFFQGMDLQGKEACLVELQAEYIHLQEQCETAMARLRLVEDRSQPEIVELRLELDKKITETKRLLSENRNLQNRLIAADQAKQLVQKQLVSAEEQAEKEKGLRLGAIQQVKLLEAQSKTLALTYQNQEQQLLAQHQGRLDSELRQLQSRAHAASECALIELNQLRTDMTTTKNKNTQLCLERDQLAKRNQELEADKHTLSLQTSHDEERVLRLKERIQKLKLRLQGARGQERLPAASDEDETEEDQGTSWGEVLVGALTGGAAGLFLGASGHGKTLPAGSNSSRKGLTDGSSRRKLSAP